jgi:hypothetical protein
MANITIARGDITLISPECDVILTLVDDVFNRYALNNCYPIALDAYSVPDELWSEYKAHDDDELVIEKHTFAADGRWAFAYNIEALLSGWKKHTKDADKVALLEGNDFSIQFDYTDYDPGMDWLIRESAILEHKAGEPIEAVKPCTIDSETFDLTVENLVEIAGERREDAEEILGVGESA